MQQVAVTAAEPDHCRPRAADRSIGPQPGDDLARLALCPVTLDMREKLFDRNTANPAARGQNPAVRSDHKARIATETGDCPEAFRAKPGRLCRVIAPGSQQRRREPGRTGDDTGLKAGQIARAGSAGGRIRDDTGARPVGGKGHEGSLPFRRNT